MGIQVIVGMLLIKAEPEGKKSKQINQANRKKNRQRALMQKVKRRKHVSASKE